MTFPYPSASIDLDFQDAAYFGAAAPTDVLSISRASIGYAKNADGTLTQFANDTLRIGVGTGLLIEDARTNLVQQSQDFTTTWGKSGFTINTGIIAPDGTSTADQFVETSVTVQFEVFQTIAALVTATTYAFSVWLKQESRPYAFLNIADAAANNWITAVFDLSLGVVGETAHGSSSGTVVSSSIEAFANGWYRCTVVGSLTITTNPDIVIGRANVASGNSFNNVGEILTTGTVGTLAFDAWGAQIEQASFASSYIPTTTASATRAADAVTATGALNTILTALPNSVYADVSFVAVVFAANWVQVGDNAGFTSYLTIQAGASNDSNVISFSNSFVSLPKVLTNAQFNNGNLKAASAQDSGGRSVTGAGQIPASDANTVLVPSTASIGSNNSGSNHTFSYLRRLAVWNARLSDATLQALTTQLAPMAQICM